MHTTARRAVHTALLTGGLVVAGAVAAHAAEDDGLLSGLGIQAPVDVSVDVQGLAAGVLGDASVTGTAPAAAPAPAAPFPAPAGPAPAAPFTGGSSDGVASGTAVAAPVSVPVDVDAVAVGVVGDASTTTAPATAPEAAPAPAPAATVAQGTSDGIASGSAVAAPVSVPVDVDAVALGILGDATVSNGAGGSSASAPATTVVGGDSDGIASGTGVVAPVHIPVTIGDIALGLLGSASATGGTDAGTPAATTPTAVDGSGDSTGIATGTDAVAPITVPITIGDVALGLIGDASTENTGTGTSAPAGTAPTTQVGTGDSDGLLSGTDVTSPIHIPVTIGDVALGLIGDASTENTGTGTSTPAGTTPTTDAETGTTDGIASGTDVDAPITAPITIGDVALGLIGDASTSGGTEAGTPGTPGTPVTEGDPQSVLPGLSILLPITLPVTVGNIALGVVTGTAVTDDGTGTTDGGTGPGTTDPGTTDPGTTDPGTTPGTIDGTGTGTVGAAGTRVETVADVVYSSEVLAAGELAVALEAATSTGVMAPAALAPTGGPAGLMSLVAAGMVGLGLLLRRLPRVVLH
jgi:hypothetical protein